ncbi:ervatamin-B-like [Daphnia pulicaria]|uniref:ervatamin-B-like n=1 Tax=Daphnia pulicaria TaxID=35523 RepID=UPI001EEA8B6B|nr:ervatamin-B-like [Daphnia pulicaria]
MKKFLFKFLVCSILVVFVNSYSDDDAWNDYKLTHKKDYTGFFGGGWRDQMRKKLFLVEYAKIKEHNSGESPSYRRGLNKFSDMLPSEWSRYLGLNKAALVAARLKAGPTKFKVESRDVSPTLDLRYDICLPEVKDQGQCGSCWAFAAVAPLEFAQCKKDSTRVVLSERQLVDCDRLDGGCNGGMYTNAWTYMQNAGGSAKQTLYSPYNARQNFCKFRSSMVGAQVSTFDFLPANNPLAMQEAMEQHGLLAVAIAVVNSFMSFRGDVYDDNACDDVDVNHAVVVVGWGTLNGVDYWMVRNSWGTNWGLSGYIRIKRGVNKCGIESYPAYVVPA